MAEDGNLQVVDAPPEASEPRGDQKPLLFISHRHADKRIADVIREFVHMRSSGAVEVFQSSSAEARGPVVGENLNLQLMRNLWQANMVILVYTAEDEDWAYCMWECGVALQPQTPRTRIVVFQIGTRSPAVFEGEVRVDAHDFKTIESFTNDFLTGKDFFPRYQGPLTKFTRNGSSVKAAAQEFNTKLLEVVGDVVRPEVEELPYPYMRLELSPDQVKKINDVPTLAAARDVILDAVVADADREARRIFGRMNMPPRATFRSLFAGWKSRYPDEDENWLDGLVAQMTDIAQGFFPTLRWELMRPTDKNDGTWYAPVVNRVQRGDDELHTTQFDVYFDKFALDSKTGCVQVGLPESARPVSA